MFDFLKKKKAEEPKPSQSAISKLAERGAKKEGYIQSVMEKTGWDHDTAEAAMKKAKSEYGIKFSDYARYGFYEAKESEQKEKAEAILARKETLKVQREQCITLAMDKCGWSRKQAADHLDATRARTGGKMSYKDYRRYYFFNIPDDQQVERYEEILKSRDARKDRKGNEKAKYIPSIMEATGWSKGTVLAKIKDAQTRTGATFKDYYAFKFWEIDEEEQAKYFTQKKSNAISKKYDKNEFHRDILLNKELSCYHFSEFFRRPWCISREKTFEEFKEIFAECSKVVYKPLDGNGGLGIKVYDITGERIKEVYFEIQTLSRGVVEGFVIQHPDMASLAPSSVNTVRIVTICDGKSTELAYVAMRVGSGKSVVDNFTDGGMVVGVDMETGKVVTPGCTISGVPFEDHPETGTHFRGFQIPYYKEAIELAKEAGKTITGYIGWDVAITVDGPVLIEANIMPGNRILQMPYVPDRIGRMEVMERFL